MGRQREGGQKKRGAGVAKPWETRKSRPTSFNCYNGAGRWEGRGRA